ncbi:hypothetical protein BOW53_03180 [Solemya pervernicosa gill symbiont]|uniref:GGDEF domain-containing protein n=2 Tax=Gammaproteobacteria incertae sedis TaxID=118884 RepID=A0A1T2L8U4_9GAMM|nr:GGDEF domain-containing protein [Candidatus Reidiella endopervernicosa]OOZ41527.1 hypothetical protein BOW53_03180 [Solemya pervernicosa gill symbiont]QKQ27929.1 GGDEF domain-containing protein [Candidatus Reidiella endopervernicosa]
MSGLRAHAISKGEVGELELRLMADGGEEKIVELEGELYLDSQGSPIKLEGTVQDVTERREIEAVMVRRANFDGLTGLPNRNLFFDRLSQAIKVSHREQHQLALLFIDLDRFKWVNDNYGHNAGDELLEQVARRLELCIREADTVARMGGDEFTVILPEVESEESTVQVVERVLEQLALPFTLLQEHEVEISGSVGVAIYPRDADSIEALIKGADSAMYAAKQRGRNAYTVFQKST